MGIGNWEKEEKVDEPSSTNVLGRMIVLFPFRQHSNSNQLSSFPILHSFDEDSLSMDDDQ
jgi:hypothetical protein